MPVYIVKPHKTPKGDYRGYNVTSLTKKIPSYFTPGLGSIIAHDITDHILHDPNIHPLMDELTAIGSELFRKEASEGSPSRSHSSVAEIQSLIECFNQMLKPSDSLERIEETIHQVTDFKYTGKIYPYIKDMMSEAVEGYELRPYQALYAEKLIKAGSAALSKGYKAASKYYRIPFAAEDVHEKVKGSLGDLDYKFKGAVLVRYTLNRHAGSLTCEYRPPHVSKYKPFSLEDY